MIATPIGLVLAGGFAALSAVDTDRPSAALLQNLLLAALAAWLVVSLTFFPDVDVTKVSERNSWPLVLLATVGIGLFAFAVVRYAMLYRERRSTLVLAFAAAFVLLAESLFAIAVSRNWKASWWEWHLLMLAAFALIACSAHREWHEERFSPLYRDETTAATRTISVLFADLSGFTSYSERREAAEVSAMLNTYFGVAIPALERHGGEVDRLIGDAVFATFAGDGHTERAARGGAGAAGGYRRRRRGAPGLAPLPRRRAHGRGERRRPRHGLRPHLQRGRGHGQPRRADRGPRPGRGVAITPPARAISGAPPPSRSARSP